ncbi:MAG TPA: serine hydroxymethyltransferase [Candidatus Paceibacterota bacterium]
MKDKAVEKLIKAERARQKKVVNLIASENYVSQDVLDALGSELTNKYAEGYSGKRYYGGNTIIDKVEDLAAERALKLFGLSSEKWHVNTQALSGSPANLSVYVGLLEKGDKVMGMSLDQGGHLTHGHKVSATGKFWTQVPYGVSKDTEVLDYTNLKEIALREKPKMIIAGFTAYPCKIDWKKFREIADACGAILMVDMSHIAGLVAGGAYPSPFEYADVVTTTTHKTLRGPRGALIFSRTDKTKTNAQGKEVRFSDLIDRAVFPGLQGGPHENQTAAIAVALKEAASPAFKKYAKQIIKNAQTLAAELSRLGWRIISGGTDSHLILVDVTSQGSGINLGGKEASDKLEKAGIIVNKNAIPFDERPPVDPSGIRLGTAAETTRGRKERDMIVLAKKIDKVLRGK